MKLFLKHLLVPVLASRPIAAIAERMTQPGVPIFMFHRFESARDGVKGHSPEHLDKCLQYLSNHHYHFVSIEQVILSFKNKTPLPQRSVAFTIDDGFLDQATIAAPIFLKHQCPVTIFLISGMLDKELWPWDDQASYLIQKSLLTNITVKIEREKKTFNIGNNAAKKHTVRSIQNWIKTLDATQIEKYLHELSRATKTPLTNNAPVNYQTMSWDMARDLEKKGIRFAPHTRSHRILSRLGNTESKFEITHSWKRLKEELVSPCPIFCYPTGRDIDFTEREIAFIKEAGLIGGVSTQPAFANAAKAGEIDYTFKLPRLGFPDTLTDVIQYSSWIERAK